ncbi:PAS domain S-box-containing protein [Desulfonatronum zhilinae]|nr:PAS domain S-box-containing protein [Desulfonatronum zhilinae]
MGPLMPEQNTQNDSDPLPGFDLQDIFDNAPIGIFTSTPEGRFISANPSIAKMQGYDSPEELIESVTDIAAQVYADPEDRKKFIRLLEEHGEVVNHECRFRRRDGTAYWVSSSVRTLRNSEGRIVAYQGFTTDISECKRIERHYQDLLENINDVVFLWIWTGGSPTSVLPQRISWGKKLLTFLVVTFVNSSIPEISP